MILLRPPLLALYDQANGILLAGAEDLQTRVEAEDFESVVLYDSTGLECKLRPIEGAEEARIGCVPVWILGHRQFATVRHHLASHTALYLDDGQEPLLTKFWDSLETSDSESPIT